MKTLKKILFFADGSKGEKKALRTAIQLAEHGAASLSVVSFVQAVGSNDPGLKKAIREIQSSIIDERQTELQGFLTGLLGEDRVKISVVPAEKSFVALIKMVVAEKFDLVVKAADPKGAIGTAIFGSLDQRLLRQCPAPLWLVKPGRKGLKSILAAVDLSADDKKMFALAKKIVALSTSIARIEGAELHVMTIWDQHAGSAYRRQLDVKLYDRLMLSLKQEISSRFNRLLEGEVTANIHVERHFVRGEPDQVIEKFVSKNAIDLIVMGTLSRTGVPGLFIGNTAERVLGDVDCSMLTLKPQGFKTVIAKV